jgi:hypothetical protein
MSETTVKSLPAAAYLVAKGAKLIRCEPLGEPGRVSFIFDDPQSIVAATAASFFTGESVAARDFYRALQDVRWAVNRALNSKGGAR